MSHFPDRRPPKGLVNMDQGILLGHFDSRRRKRVWKRVGRVLAPGALGPAGVTQAEIRFYAYSPSSRMRFAFGLAFKRDDGFPVISYPSLGPQFPATAVWAATAEAKDAGTGAYVDVQPVFPGVARQLPDSWETDSAGERVFVQAVITIPDPGGPAAGQTGEWLAWGGWEPNTPIKEPELDHLFADCDLVTDGEVLLADAAPG